MVKYQVWIHVKGGEVVLQCAEQTGNIIKREVLVVDKDVQGQARVMSALLLGLNKLNRQSRFTLQVTVSDSNVRAMLHGSMQSRKHADLLGRCIKGVDHFKAEVL
jgi:hypothetical protein